MVEIMNIIELQEKLKNLNIDLTASEICKIWGMDKGAFSRKKTAGTEIRLKHILKLEEALGIKLINYDNYNQQNINNEIIKIPYFDWLPEEMKNPKYSYVAAQKISIVDWGNGVDNLRIVAMNGDKMELFWYRIRNKDVLLVDVNETKVNNNGSGVYFATSRGNTQFWIREMTETIDGGIEFKAYAPSGVTVRAYTKQQLVEADFQVIGRVIKNVSLTI